MNQWAATLNALPHVDPRQKDSQWFGVMNAFAILANPDVCARMDLSPSDPRLIDPKSMVLRGDTVFVLSKPRREHEAAITAGIFVSLLLDTFQEACQDLAFDRASGSRGKIEPPVRFVLDELSNLEAWPTMTRSTGGSARSAGMGASGRNATGIRAKGRSAASQAVTNVRIPSRDGN